MHITEYLEIQENLDNSEGFPWYTEKISRHLLHNKIKEVQENKGGGRTTTS